MAAVPQNQNQFSSQLGNFKVDAAKLSDAQQAIPLLGLSEDQLARLSDDLRSPIRGSATSSPLQ